MGASTAQLMPEFLAEIASRPVEREQLIPLLQRAQATFGYLPREAMEGIARSVRLPLSRIQGVATFYNQFRFTPPAEKPVHVCLGTACHVRGADRVLTAMEDTLKIQEGQTTPDGRFSLERVACVGACGLAPVAVVGGRTYGRLTPDRARRLLRRARA